MRIVLSVCCAQCVCVCVCVCVIYLVPVLQLELPIVGSQLLPEPAHTHTHTQIKYSPKLTPFDAHLVSVYDEGVLSVLGQLPGGEL